MDWKDDEYFYNVILREQEEEEENQQLQNTYSNFEVTPPGGAVIGLTVFLCFAALFMGYAHIIGTLLGMGFIAFLIINSLFS